MTPEIAAPIANHLDMLALALAAGAKWWRTEIRAGGLPGLVGGVTPDQLDTFEGQLLVGMAKLVLHEATEGTSRKEWGEEWVVQALNGPDEVLRSAAIAARIKFQRLPRHAYLKLRVIDDQVHVHVMKLGYLAERQIWPVAA